MKTTLSTSPGENMINALAAADIKKCPAKDLDSWTCRSLFQMTTYHRVFSPRAVLSSSPSVVLSTPLARCRVSSCIVNMSVASKALDSRAAAARPPTNWFNRRLILPKPGYTRLRIPFWSHQSFLEHGHGWKSSMRKKKRQGDISRRRKTKTTGRIGAVIPATGFGDLTCREKFSKQARHKVMITAFSAYMHQPPDI